MFHNREDAARLLARQLKGRPFRDPLVLAIPHGGVVTGAVLAKELKAELDVAMAGKLRAPGQPDVPVGAIAEDGRIYVNSHAGEFAELPKAYLLEECRYALSELLRRRNIYRRARPKATIEGRTVILTDDGIATGSTMLAVLQAVGAQRPREIIVAVPVSPADRLAEVSRGRHEIVCLISSDEFWTVGQFYQEFPDVEDDRVVWILRQAANVPKPAEWAKPELFPEPAESLSHA